MTVPIFDYSPDHMKAWVATGEVLDTSAAAALTGLSRWTLADAVRDGKLDGFGVPDKRSRTGVKYYVFRDKLDAWHAALLAWRERAKAAKDAKQEKRAKRAEKFAARSLDGGHASRGGKAKKAARLAAAAPPEPEPEPEPVYPLLPVPSRASRLLARALVKEHMLRRETRRRMMAEPRPDEYEQALQRCRALFEAAR